jgi:hypothetical protein
MKQGVVHRFCTRGPATPPTTNRPGPVVDPGVPIGNSTASRIARPDGAAGDHPITIGPFAAGAVAPAQLTLRAGQAELW